MINEEFRLGISFSIKRGCVLIYQDTLRALENPGCFRFLINNEDRKIAMQVCKFGEDGFHITPEFSVKRSSYEIYSTELVRMIWNMCGWYSQCSYRVIGNFFPKEKIVEFDLNQAEKIADDDF